MNKLGFVRLASVNLAKMVTSSRIGAVLLAAGPGSRMGHRPKSLLELDGVPLIRRQLSALSGAGIAQVVLVLGHYATRIEAAVKDWPVTRAHNLAPQAGQTSSLRLGLQALPPELDAVVVALADQPLITAGDIGDLLKAYEERPAGTQLVQPTVDGLPGNPVMFSAQVRTQMLAAGADVGGQQWKAAHPGEVHRWVSTNSHYRQDLDTLHDIEVLGQQGHRLSWPADLDAPPSGL
jgi:molybdenum cofactor cytidylyltransferase